MITKSDSFENLACELLSGNPSREAVDTLCNEPSFLAFANKNEISGAIVASIDLTGKSSIVPIAWRDAYNSIQAQVSEYLSETDSIASVLKEQGILLVVLKNGGIARNIYCFAGAVPMGDIDVLVRKCDFRQAHQILLNNGYQFEFRSELEKEDLDEAEQGGGAEYWKLLPNGEKLWFELQWRPVAGRWIRPDQEPAAEALMARSIPIEGTDVRLLAPEDNLLQVCLHTAKHSYVRAPGFRLHLDVVRIVEAYPDLDWDLFVAQVVQLQVKTATYFSLLIPKALFETPVPEAALAQLRQQREDVHLILAGPDERGGEAEVRHLVSALAIEQDVTFTGMVGGAEKLSILQDCDVYALVSPSEGLSIALLEAMYMGLPIVATNRIGLSSEIQQEIAGIVVERNIEQIAAALLEMVCNVEQRRQMGVNAHKLVAQKYTWDVIAQALITAVEERTK